ncbi:unnamed protein product [Lymnaea stagnalis]|uniref:Uncharacterized protein n=1 Tax=Lymnaea stagnalis TaxID=6523 RepID=A0AAV2IFL6_LYMST
MDFRNASLLWKIVFFIQIIGFILGLIAFGTNYLASGFGAYKHDRSRVEVSVGLWQYCENAKCAATSDVLVAHDRSTVWLNASKVMMGLSLVGEFVTIIMTSLVIFLTLTKIVGQGTLVVAGISVLFGVIGAAVAGGESKRVFNDINGSNIITSAWSFTLFMIVQLLYFVAGGLYFLDLRWKS